MSRLIARIAKMIICVISPTQYELTADGRGNEDDEQQQARTGSWKHVNG